MALVSDIEIRLRADIARLQQDLTQARQSVSSTMDRITSVAKGAMAGLAAIGGVGLFAGFIKSAIDATDAISDVSQRTGIAVEDLAGLQLWFQKGGMEADALEGAMIKLSRSIAGGSDELKNMGIRTRDANGNVRSSTAVLMDAADAFSKMEDGTAKTALAVEVFGKSGAALLPMLNEGSEGLREMTEMADKLGLTFDQKTVDAAGDFNDTLDFMGMAAQGVGRQVAAQLLPTLNSLLGTMFKFATAGDGVRKAADVIGTGLKVIYTAGVGIVTMFNAVAETISGALSFVGNNLATLFTALKQGIEGNYADAWRTITNGGMRASAIMGVTLGNLKNEFTSAASTIGDAWTETGGEAVAALAHINRGSRGAREATSDEAKEAKKMAEAYAALVSQVEARVDASEREAMGLGKLSEAEQFEIELTKQLADGKIKLSAAQEKYLRSRNAEAGANAVVNKSQKEYDDLLQKLADNAAKAEQERAGLIESARQEAEENEFLAKTVGMTEDAVIRLRAGRLLEQEAQRLGRELTADEIADLKQVIDLKERSAKAIADKRAAEEQRDFWASVEKTAHDTFVSIADGGKDTFQRLKETAKNTFFDWLYQQTIKKWIINIQTNGVGNTISGLMNGQGGMAGWLEAGKSLVQGFSQNLSSSIGGVISKLGTAFGSKAATSFGSSISSSASAGGIAAAIVAGMMANNKFYDDGWRMDGQMGDIIKSQFNSMLKGNGFAPLIAVMTASMGTFDKLLKGLGVNGKLASMLSGSAVFARAFGRKAPTIEAEGIRGSITAAGFTGEAFAEILEKGGWFRSDKRYTKGAALGAEQEKGFDQTLKGIADSIRAFSMVLGAETSAIDGYNKQINLTLTKDEAQNQKLIEAMFSGIGDELAERVLPDVEKFAQQGETASTTLQRLAGNFQAVDAILKVMGTDSLAAFRAVGVASIEARERLVALAGGVDALATKTAFFTENFLTEAEQIALVQKPLSEGLSALGYASLTTMDQFKAAVQGLIQSGATATEEGAKQFAGLLALAPQFKIVQDYLKDMADEQAATAQEAADKALALARSRAELEAQILEMQGDAVGALTIRRRLEIEQTEESLRPLMDRIYALQDEAAAAERLAQAVSENEDKLLGLVDQAMAALDRAVQAQKQKVTTAYQDSMKALEESIKVVNGTIERTGALSKALRGAIGQNPGDNGGMRSQVARAEITAALTIARASGMLPTAESLANALAAVTMDASDDYSTLQEYQRAVARTNAELEALGGLSDKELTTAEKQLKALEEQKTATTAAYEAEIKRLDDILANAQAQVDAIKGVDNSVRSVEAALSSLGVALGALKTAPTTANPGGGIVGGGRTVTVEDLYREVLGRAPDAGGLAFWKNYAGDSVSQDEYLMFLKGAQDELKNRVTPPPTVATSSGTMSSSSAMVTELQALNRRMESVEVNMANTAAATGQFAAQFNQVSANGNALAVETVGTL